jgi:hypothetical protein
LSRRADRVRELKGELRALMPADEHAAAVLAELEEERDRIADSRKFVSRSLPPAALGVQVDLMRQQADRVEALERELHTLPVSAQKSGYKAQIAGWQAELARFRDDAARSVDGNAELIGRLEDKVRAAELELRLLITPPPVADRVARSLPATLAPATLLAQARLASDARGFAQLQRRVPDGLFVVGDVQEARASSNGREVAEGILQSVIDSDAGVPFDRAGGRRH